MDFRRYTALFQIAKLSDHALGCLLDCLTDIDCEQLVLYPNIPLLYQSGVRYFHDGKDDPWMDVLSILAEHEFAMKEGNRAIVDCEDLSCWRAAELRVKYGINANPTWIRRKRADGKQLVHIFVRLPDGTFEDPSRLLGMGGLSQANNVPRLPFWNRAA